MNSISSGACTCVYIIICTCVILITAVFQVVPETKLPPSTLLPPLPESSPFRPDPEDTPTATTRTTTKLWDEDDSVGVEAEAKESAGSSYTATVASCSQCKVQ